MVLNLMQKSIGLNCVKDCIILPFATGMSLTISLQTLKSECDKTPEGKLREYVLFPRIDQKTCLKSIYTANLIPIVIEPVLEGDELRTNLKGIEEVLNDPKYKGKILGVQTTTSCFAPRAYDSVVEVAKLCKKYNIHHIINSAYGLQCSKIASDIV